MDTQSICSNKRSCSNSNNSLCRYCQTPLNKENTIRKGRKSCKICSLQVAQEREAKKANSKEGPDTIFCKRCKLHLNKMLFIKFLKQCEKCRNKVQEIKQSKKVSINGSVENANNNYYDITAEEIFIYLKKRYNIKEDLDQIINEIVEAEDATETESYEEEN